MNDSASRLVLKKSMNGLINTGDVCVLVFKARLVSGSGYIKPYIQASKNSGHKKALFAKTSYGSEWTTCYLPFVGIEDMDQVGFRFSGALHQTEIKDMQIINYKNKVSMSDLPSTIIQ